MKSHLGIFLNAPESMKALCLPFQALHIKNTLVRPSADRADRCFGSLFLRQDAAVCLTRGVHPAGADVPSPLLRVRYSGLHPTL